MVCNFNMSLLDFEQNKKVQIFVNIIIFGHSMIPIINKPTRVTKESVTTLDLNFTCSITTNLLLFPWKNSRCANLAGTVSQAVLI